MVVVLRLAEVHMRTELLELYARVQAITDGYDGVEGYLGETFCEDAFGMVRTGRGTKDVDGHVGAISVQTKFKWITPQNLKTRYVTVKPDADFDVMIVTYAEPGGSEVRLFGIWEKEQVLSVMKPTKQLPRVNLTDLRQLPEYCFDNT